MRWQQNSISSIYKRPKELHSTFDDDYVTCLTAAAVAVVDDVFHIFASIYYNVWMCVYAKFV